MHGRTVGVLTAVLVAGCAVAGCAQSAAGARVPVPVDPGARCVQAVLGVLADMVGRPYDSRPFEDFVTTYGPGTVTYEAYLHAFTSFHSLTATTGVRTAEDRLRPLISEECAAPPATTG